MNKDSTDFMIEEYEQIASAYFGLQDRMSDWFRLYVTLVGLPLTVLAATVKITDTSQEISIFGLPVVISGLLMLVSLLGLFVTLTIVSIRMEMILYARTINGIRRYFAELDQLTITENKSEPAKKSLIKFLILPTADTLPPFYEQWGAVFWQVLMIGFLDSILFTIAVQNLYQLERSFLVGIGVFLLHFLIYWFSARRRNRMWKVHFKENINIPAH